MTRIFIDIETIPAQDPAVRAKIAEGVTHPGNISKAESIDKWNEEKRPAAIEEAIVKTALDGTYGHVCCIGIAFDDAEPCVLRIGHSVSTELLMLDAFAETLNNNVTKQPLAGLPVIIGHNVIGFDIRFLWQRAIILGVRMPTWFPRDPRPWDGTVFDTMTAWAGQRGMIGLDRLCQALGIPGKDDIDGSMVGQMWAEGRHDEIAEYCRQDVERVRAVHRKMQIAFGEAPEQIARGEAA